MPFFSAVALLYNENIFNLFACAMTSTSYLLCGFLLIGAFSAFGQNVGINENGAPPHTSAILHVQSLNKGLLVPRMTSA
jgi:hypothetical protein